MEKNPFSSPPSTEEGGVEKKVLNGILIEVGI
jgi:hypothetical protein